MFNPPKTSARCLGTLDRRSFVRSGVVGLTSLGLADLLALESQAAAAGRSAPSHKALLVLWPEPHVNV